MKLNFIVPSYPIKPGGGHKMMYEYANRLAISGHDVLIYHVLTVPGEHYRLPAWVRNIRAKLFFNSPPAWFDFSSQLKSTCIPYINNQTIRDADITIGTQWLVATQINQLAASKGKKINFIQDYETWIGHDINGLHASYALPLYPIVIADYLVPIYRQHSTLSPKVIYNAIDTCKFCITTPIKDRFPHSISMLYSQEPRKGSQWGIKALRICKQHCPDLKVRLFGISERPKDLESWFAYEQCPSDLPALYNSTAIFFTPSIKEGWGLPATEAMACGCALVCTRVDGHLVFGKDEHTALLTEPENSQNMADKLLELLHNQSKRIQIAQSAHSFVQQYSWDRSIKELTTVFQNILDERADM